MAEIMEAHPSQLGFRQQAVEDTIADVMRVQEASCLARENPKGHFSSYRTCVDLTLKEQVFKRLA